MLVTGGVGDGDERGQCRVLGGGLLALVAGPAEGCHFTPLFIPGQVNQSHSFSSVFFGPRCFLERIRQCCVHCGPSTPAGQGSSFSLPATG